MVIKKIYIISLILIVLFLVGCTNSLPVVEQEQATKNANYNSNKPKLKKMIYSLDLPPSNNWCQATRKFAELVNEKSKGNIEIEVFDSASLGTQRDALEGMLVGTINGTVSLEPLSYWVRDIGMFGIPFLFRDEQHLRNFIEGEAGKELQQKIISAGFRPLTYFIRAPRQITSNIPINSVKDLKSITIRLPEAPTAPQAFEAMGARTVIMPFSDVFSAIQSGIVNAQENPIDMIVANKFYKIQKYLAITNHQYQIAYLLIGEETYQKLNEDEKKVISEAALETQAFANDLLREDLKNSEQVLIENNIIITRPNIDEFIKAAEKASGRYDSLMQEWIAKIKSLE